MRCVYFFISLSLGGMRAAVYSRNRLFITGEEEEEEEEACDLHYIFGWCLRARARGVHTQEEDENERSFANWYPIISRRHR